MNDAIGADAEELLFESFLPSPPDSQSWDPSEVSDDEILLDHLDDSQPTLITESDDDYDRFQAPYTVVPDRYFHPLLS